MTRQQGKLLLALGAFSATLLLNHNSLVYGSLLDRCLTAGGAVLMGIVVAEAAYFVLARRKEAGGTGATVPTPPVSPPSGLARRAARFVGRAEELARLHRALAASGKAGIASGLQSQPNAVLSGMGGIGKTELAVHYALTYGDEYERVFFLDADTRENLARNILDTIAPALEVPLPDPRDVPEAARRAHGWRRIMPGRRGD